MMFWGLAVAGMRKTDKSPWIVLINTIMFGVGAGLVGYCWLLYSIRSPVVSSASGGVWTFQEQLFLMTIALLLAGFFHSAAILYPSIKRRTEDQIRAKMEADNYKSLAMKDPLTGIYNRRYFLEIMDAYIKEFKIAGVNFGVMLLDLDELKYINDKYGHEEGDILIMNVASCMRAVAGKYDVVARLGGDEFAIVLPIADRKQLAVVADDYRDMISQLRANADNDPHNASVSIGIAMLQDGSSAKQILKAADENLYIAKQKGKNQVAG
ncbi:MAG: GGDEF domain-containing protein [Pseudomonadota bacterium]